MYAITDSNWLNGRTLYSVVKESLEGGVTFLQLREKELDEEHFLEEARELQKLCREYQVPFVINDNVDIAAAINADGVHVGQSDMEKCVILRYLYSLNPLISLMRDKIILQLQLIMPGSVSMTLCRNCSISSPDEATACT